jgi:uncharacterized repeat protein (TIGR01451 family)
MRGSRVTSNLQPPTPGLRPLTEVTTMSSKMKVARAIAFMLMASASDLAAAQDKSCISLNNEAQVEQEYVDPSGQKAKRLVPPGKVLPGREVIYTITAKNGCSAFAERVVIDNPVPQHMTYVMGSAFGVGTDITYSVDGKTYAKADALTVTQSDGKTRPAQAADIRSIRWTYGNAFSASASGFVRFRATVK